MIEIGPHALDSNVVLAPMAGVTDLPFRQLCRAHGAGLTPSEMLSSNVRLWNREKGRLRRCHDTEQTPRVIQIAGADPAMMAQAARLNAEEGAQIIDINMGCPAKKVLKRSAGSALLQYPGQVEEILRAVVAAVDIPVTLKIRTGWDTEHRNGVDIAKLAEDCGIQSLAVHGRTRACAFKGNVEYDTIAAIKQAVSMPVFANGDITTPEQAQMVLEHTGADGIMIGRGAQGRPWIFNEISHFLATGKQLRHKTHSEILAIVIRHLNSLYDFYGAEKGVFFARKHFTWYLAGLTPRPGSAIRHEEFAAFIRSARQTFNRLPEPVAQLEFADAVFRGLMQNDLSRHHLFQEHFSQYKPVHQKEQQSRRELAA